MTCPSCGFRFEGLAAHCPQCEAPLPPTANASTGTRTKTTFTPPGAGWRRPTRPGKGQWAIAVAAGVAVGAVVLFAFALVAFQLHFCLDLDFGSGPDETDDCADERAASERLMLVGLGAALGSAALVVWLVLRTFRTRNLRAQKSAAARR